MPFTLVYLLFTPLLFSLLHALSPTRSYSHGPVPFDKIASLYYTLSPSGSTISFALVVKDPKIVSNTSRFEPNWLGLGVSEPTSGSMLGGDIVTAVFRSDGSCVFTDRYVPFFAFPLGEPGPGGSAFPLEDDCQDDGSWRYITCKRDSDTMLLEVERELEAHDDQDRAIKKEDGSSSLIYAYGEFFGYHQDRRGAMQVDLFKEKDGEQSMLPPDVDGSIEIVATNYTVPDSKETIYACTSKLVNIEGSSGRMIVAAEPVIHADVDMLHHLVLYLCSGEEYAKQTAKTIECTTGNNSIGGPVGNPRAKCSTLVYGCKLSTRLLSMNREHAESLTFLVLYFLRLSQMRRGLLASSCPPRQDIRSPLPGNFWFWSLTMTTPTPFLALWMPQAFVFTTPIPHANMKQRRWYSPIHLYRDSQKQLSPVLIMNTLALLSALRSFPCLLPFSEVSCTCIQQAEKYIRISLQQTALSLRK